MHFNRKKLRMLHIHIKYNLSAGAGEPATYKLPDFGEYFTN